MAGIQVGDIVKITQVAWKVYEYGWSSTHNASRQYQEFGNDVKVLAQSVDHLFSMISKAGRSFQDRGLTPPTNLASAWDHKSLFEIVGDFQETLTECQRLLESNRSYSTTTGAAENITWNVFVQPNVDRLQQRIQLHHSKVQHVLRPFELDLHLRIHSDLSRQIQEVYQGVHGVKDEVRSLRKELLELRQMFDPDSLQVNKNLYFVEDFRLNIPPAIIIELTDNFYTHPESSREVGDFRLPPLKDMADAFIGIFNMSTLAFQPTDNDNEPSEDQYIFLLASQFLMDMMMESTEYKQPSSLRSHWPSYVKSLKKQLSEEGQRFTLYMVTPIFTDAERVPSIWPKEEPMNANVESVRLPVMMEYLLELPLLGPNPNTWRKLKLLRYCDKTDHRFRLLLAGGPLNSPPTEFRTIDFNITKSSLVPSYANYDNTNGGPLEVILKAKNEMHSLKFGRRAELYKFQQAITGYEVVDQYMGYNMQVVFVPEASPDNMVMENASMQLWRPSRVEGEPVTDDPDSWGSLYKPGEDQRYSSSTGSTHSVPTPSGRSAASSEFQQSLPIWQDSRAQSAFTFATSAPRDPEFNPWSLSNTVDRSSPDDMRSYFPDSYNPRGPANMSLGRSALNPNHPVGHTPPLPHAHTAGYSQPKIAPDFQASSTRIAALRGWIEIGEKGRGYKWEDHGEMRGGYKRATTTTGQESLMSFATTASSGTRTIAVSGATNLKSQSTLHCVPTEPLMVLFTKNAKTNTHSVVAITIDDHTNANYFGCQCINGTDCRISTLEQINKSSLNILRLGPGGTIASKFAGVPQWDILPLSESLRSERAARQSGSSKIWRKMMRVSICHDNRGSCVEFAGMPCICLMPKNEGELMTCLASWHRGRLGLLKESYRREMVEWDRNRYQTTGNVILS